MAKIKTRIAVLFLAIASMACLQQVPPERAQNYTAPALVESGTTPPASQTPNVIDAKGAFIENYNCAIVTAIQSLNLREKPDENSTVTHWLQAGEIVTVNSQGEWWNVTAGAYTGYAKADYLKESECR